MTRYGRPAGAVALVALLLLGACGAPPTQESTSAGAEIVRPATPAVTSAPTTGPLSVAPATGPKPTTATSTAGPAMVKPTTSRPTPKPTTPRPTTQVTPPPCPVNLAAQLASTQGASQLVTVDAPSTGATTATVALWQRSGLCWIPAGGPWPAGVGRSGLSGHHREGDGTTPTGAYRISPVFYGIAPDPGVHGSYHRLVCGDWWDEDPTSPQYNSFQHVACGTAPPFGGASEALWTETTASQRFAVIEYNTGPVVAGAGSGIFVHDDTGGPTNGCVSLLPAQLDLLLRWLQPSQSPLVVIGTDAEIRQF